MRTYWREVFDGWLTRIAGVLLLLIVAVLIFNTVSDIPYRIPIIGMITFTLEPVLFIVGGVVFVFTIRRM